MKNMTRMIKSTQMSTHTTTQIYSSRSRVAAAVVVVVEVVVPMLL